MTIPWGIVAKVAAVAAPTAAAIVLAGMLARACDRARVAEGEVGRQREAADLLKEKFSVAVQDAQAARAEADRLLDADAALRAEFERLKTASPGVKLVAVREATGAPTVATGQPVQAPPTTADCPAAPLCLVPPGALLAPRVLSLDARTDKGNLVALTHLLVDRVAPAPRTTILDEILQSKFTTLPPEPPKPNLALSAGPWFKNPGSKDSGWTTEVRGGIRVYRDAWLDAAARFDNQYSAALRWEFR